MAHMIAPSILSAHFGYLSEAIGMLNESEADWIHVDVMDGHFVPNISFGFPVMEVLKVEAKKPLDVHLMIEKPELYIDRFAQAGAYSISVHIEACVHLHRTLNQIKEAGCKAGIAVNPHTPIASLLSIIKEADFVVLMGVNPGFSAQKFIPTTLYKTRELKDLIRSQGSQTLIEIDGGVGPQNLQKLVEAGADILVAGNAVFGQSDPKGAIAMLKALK